MNNIAKAAGLVFIYTIILCASVIYWDISKWVSVPVLALCLYLLWADRTTGIPKLVLFLWPPALCNCALLATELLHIHFLFTLPFLLALWLLTKWLAFEKELPVVFIPPALLYGLVGLSIGLLDNRLYSFVIIPATAALVWRIVAWFDGAENDQEEFESHLYYTPFVSMPLLLLLNWFFPHDSNTPAGFTPQEQAQEQRVQQELDNKEKAIQQQVYGYFDSLKKNKQLSPDINPEFSLTSKVEEEKTVWNAEYSYTTRNEVFEGEVTDYAPGEYHFDASPAAYQMLKAFDYSLNHFLKKNLEAGEKVQIELHGYSDGLQFKKNTNKPKTYDGRVGNFSKGTAENSQGSIMYELNGALVKGGVELKQGDLLNNDNLAFLRAYCMKYAYLDDIVPLRNAATKTRYKFFGHTQAPSDVNDPKLRKVKIILRIVNPEPGQAPVPKPVVQAVKCDNSIAQLLCLAGSGILGFFFAFHYRRYHEKSDKNEPRKKDRDIALLSFIAALLLLALAWWLCPNSFSDMLKSLRS